MDEMEVNDQVGHIKVLVGEKVNQKRLNDLNT